MLKLLYTKESTADFKWEKEPDTDNSSKEAVTELFHSRDKGTLQKDTRLGGLRDSIGVKGKTTSMLLCTCDTMHNRHASKTKNRSCVKKPACTSVLSGIGRCRMERNPSLPVTE